MSKILVIDDSLIIRNLLSEILSDLGFEVDLAIDGQEGIDKALNYEYKIIFCDIHMPKKNGYQVYMEVSNKKQDSLFIMTDSLPDELAEMAKKAGACYCLTKPFALEEVRDTINKILTTVKSK